MTGPPATVVDRARLRHVLEERVVDACRVELVVHEPSVVEGYAAIGAIVGLGQRLQVVAGIVLRVGVARPVAVGNTLRARECVPTVLRQQIVGPALVDILHAVHGVVLIGDRISACAAGSRRPDDLGLVADSIERHLRVAAKLIREAVGLARCIVPDFVGRSRCLGQLGCRSA